MCQNKKPIINCTKKIIESKYLNDKLYNHNINELRNCKKKKIKNKKLHITKTTII